MQTVTADTITDEQIHELRRWIAEMADISAEAGVHVNAGNLTMVCVVALGVDDESTHPERQAARAECAKIFNARAARSRKHWPDCALNHGGAECDMGPECGTDAPAEVADECSTCGAIHVDVDCFGKAVR